MLSLFVGAHATAQTAWKPPALLRIVVPFPPGGSADAAARLLAEGLAAEFKQPAIVENKPGAGTTIAAAQVAASTPDGTTLLLTGPISHIASGLLYPRLRYDALRGFAAVSQLTMAPFFIVVRTESPYRTLDELIRAAKAAPGRLSYGSSGVGASPHLVGEILASEAGVKFLHVPYKGAGPATVGVIGGEVDFSVSDASAIPHLASGKLRALAVTTARRSALAPDVPSVVEAVGLKLDESAGIALLAPAGTPAAAIDALSGAIAKILSQESVVKRFAMQGMEVAPGPAAQLGASMTSLHQRYGALIQRLGIKLD
ncbi:MAG: tripartite tricarboxylate transporter substrate binding protein [Burkholderiales bacterium]|nr:tripartite tricarboxylate transporter substrate binding protein [Burkholderiales bacterium]